MKPIRLLLALIVLAATASAQTGREVRLRLLAFDTTNIPAESFVFDSAAPQPVAGVPAPIKGYLNHEALTLQTFGGELVFSRSGAVQDATNADLQLAKVTLPKAGKDFMLVFLPTGKDRFRILPLDDSIREFPLGSYRVISLSASPVRLTLEGKPFEFKPGQSSLITDVPVQANNHSAMYAYAEKDEKWQRIGAGLWPHPGLKRSVQIFFDNPATSQTELRGFRDISPPNPNAPQARNP